MFEFSREMIAYAIIGVILLTGTPLTVALLRRRQRERLRRRGIKRYGH